MQVRVITYRLHLLCFNIQLTENPLKIMQKAFYFISRYSNIFRPLFLPLSAIAAAEDQGYVSNFLTS